MKEILAHSDLVLDSIAFGTFLIPPGEETYRAVSLALEVGYRSVDTAKYYNNESDVGRAIRAAGLEGQVQVTTKIWIDELSPQKAKIAGKRSRDYLQVESIDLLLAHWPRPGLVDTWKTFLEMQEEGIVKYIGVSNFEQEHLEELVQAGLAVPSVNQVELSPLLTRAALRNYCQSRRIIVETWGPLIQGALHELASVQDIADKYRISLAQLSLRWAVQHNMRVLPKSTHRHRMEENLAIFDFEFTPEEMERIDALDRQHHCGPRPADIYHS